MGTNYNLLKNIHQMGMIIMSFYFYINNKMSYAILIKTYHKNLLSLKDGFAFLKYSLLFIFKK